MAEPYNLRVSAAGTPKMCNAGSKRQPVILLSGHSRAHYGVIVGGPSCRLVADPARHEAWALREIVGAYAHLAEHPAGVDAAVVKLRMLRRKVREVRGG